MSGVYNQGPVNEQRDTTLRDLIAVLFKRKWMILLIFAVVTSIVLGRTATLPDTYSADARILLKRQGARTSVLERNPRVLPWVEVVETELEVLKTEAVMSRAVEKLSRPSDEFPEGVEMGIFGLSRRIRVGVMNESNVLFVEGTAESPELAVAITNAVAEAYVEHHEELFALPDVAVKFETQADSVFAELARARREQQTVLDEFGITSFRDEEQTLIRQRELVRGKLIELESQIARLEIEVETARDVLEGESLELPFNHNTGSVQGGTLFTSLNELRKLDSELEAMRGRYTAEHPERRALEQDRAALFDRVQRDVRQLVAIKSNDLRAVEGEAASIRRALTNFEDRLARIPDATRRLASLNTRISTLEDQYEKFGEYIADSQANASSFQEYGATIISRALRGTMNAKGDMVRLALAPLLALMFGVFLAFYLENLDHSLGTREDVERHLDIPVLASFPDAEIEEPSATEDETRSRVPFNKRSRATEA